MPTCQFCHQSTNYTYRDIQNKDLNLNLINCCSPCSEEKDYLTISSVFNPRPIQIEQPIDLILPIAPIQDQYWDRPRREA